MAAFWLLKSEPDTFAWSDLLREGRATWDGVRNFQARNHLRAMQPGDRALFYHSGATREVVGEMEIVRAAFADPTIDDERWLAVEVRPLRTLPRPVPLRAIKADASLAQILLVRNSRLSVLPLTDLEFARILSLAGADAPCAST